VDYHHHHLSIYFLLEGDKNNVCFYLFVKLPRQGHNNHDHPSQAAKGQQSYTELKVVAH